MTGWGYSGFDTANAKTEPVNVQLLAANSKGGLYDATKNYISDTVTSGAGSVIVTDFNKDGKQDIFLAAHNESPFLPMPSTVYMSTAGGGFQKLVLPDSVAAHDVSLIHVGGDPTIMATTYMGQPSPLYVYQNGQFIIKEFPTTYATDPGKNIVLTGASSVVDSFDGSGNLQLVRGDITYYNDSWTAPVASNIEVFLFNSNNSIDQTPLQVITPYLSTLPQYKDVVSLQGAGLTHTYALYTDDVNHDGFMDVMAGQSMWSESHNDWPSALQILLNDGTGRFQDKTAVLNPSMNLNISSLDYTPTIVDIDNSGIDTYLFAGVPTNSQPERQSNYVILNDGTGKLYVGMHDEFRELSKQVHEFVSRQFGQQDRYHVGEYSYETDNVSKFIGLPQQNGSINFVAESQIHDLQDPLNPQVVYALTNVAVEYNPTVDFKQNVTIADRNDSQLIRTWAGNDVIHDANAAASTSINGGLGFDTMVYSYAFADAKVTKTVSGYTVGRADGKIDTLTGVERLAFTDQSVELPSIIDDFNPTAVYRFYNTTSGAHFYTASVHEAENVMGSLPSFRFEGVAFERSAMDDPATVDVHRFYNTAAGVHFYTANEQEVKQVMATLPAFNYEGVAYQAHSEEASGTTELYRFYNTHTGTHFYTASAEEMESVRINLSGSFAYEGVAYYVDMVS